MAITSGDGYGYTHGVGGTVGFGGLGGDIERESVGGRIDIGDRIGYRYRDGHPLWVGHGVGYRHPCLSGVCLTGGAVEYLCISIHRRDRFRHRHDLCFTVWVGRDGGQRKCRCLENPCLERDSVQSQHRDVLQDSDRVETDSSLIDLLQDSGRVAVPRIGTVVKYRFLQKRPHTGES